MYKINVTKEKKERYMRKYTINFHLTVNTAWWKQVEVEKTDHENKLSEVKLYNFFVSFEIK